MLVTGTTEAEHIANVEDVLKRLQAARIRSKKEKCMLTPEVKYLGHHISNQGIEPTEEKVRAVMKAPVPWNISELKAFIGLVNYYGKFLLNLTTVLSPLYSLLHCHSIWKWGSAQQEAFESTKDLLKSPRLLAHYDGSKELVLACDTSPYEIGAVLSHHLDNGEEQPITFASRMYQQPRGTIHNWTKKH